MPYSDFGISPPVGPVRAGALEPVPVMRHPRPVRYRFATIAVVVAALGGQKVRTLERRVPQGVTIPLAEHPRPDFQREQWQNLNGPWQFQLDAQDSGEVRGWFRSGLPAARPIIVPFPWGS